MTTSPKRKFAQIIDLTADDAPAPKRARLTPEHDDDERTQGACTTCTVAGPMQTCVSCNRLYCSPCMASEICRPCLDAEDDSDDDTPPPCVVCKYDSDIVCSDCNKPFCEECLADFVNHACRRRCADCDAHAWQNTCDSCGEMTCASCLADGLCPTCLAIPDT